MILKFSVEICDHLYIINKSIFFIWLRTKFQGKDFSLWFLERIACFMWGKERNSDSLFSERESWANCSHRSLKKSNGEKSNGSDSLLGIKWGKAVKNCQKQGENNKFFWAIRLFLLAGKIRSQKTSESLMSLFIKGNREQIDLVPLF